jgi:hypothetical protein
MTAISQDSFDRTLGLQQRHVPPHQQLDCRDTIYLFRVSICSEAQDAG